MRYCINISLSFLFFISSCVTTTHEEVDVQVKVVPNTLEDIDIRIAQEPRNSNLYHLRYLELIKEDKFADALLAINKAIELTPIPEFYLKRGTLYQSQGYFDKALESYKYSTQTDSAYIPGLLGIAKIHLLYRNYDASFLHLNKVLRVDRHNNGSYFFKGVIYAETGDSLKAASSFQTALEQNSNFVQAYHNLGSMYAKAKNSLAIEYFNTAIRLEPTNQLVLYSKAFFLQNSEKYEEAIHIYKKITSLNSKHQDALFNQGYIYLVHLEQTELSIPFFNEVVSLNSSHTNSLYNLGLAYELLEKLDSAEHYYSKVLTISPNSYQAKEGLFRID